MVTNDSSTSSQEPHPYLFRKTFDTKGDAGAARLRLLVQERDYLRNLHHPNLVKFIAYEESVDHCKAYLWTEYCNGSDLSKFIRKDYGDGNVIEPQRALTRQDTWRIIADLAAAVSYLHYGVIKENELFSLKTDWSPILHRDIKPQNGKFCHGILQFGSKHHLKFAWGLRLVISASGDWT